MLGAGVRVGVIDGVFADVMVGFIGDGVGVKVIKGVIEGDRIFMPTGVIFPTALSSLSIVATSALEKPIFKISADCFSAWNVQVTTIPAPPGGFSVGPLPKTRLPSALLGKLTGRKVPDRVAIIFKYSAL